MGWRSSETMATYLKTMNKQQSIRLLLEDEETQERGNVCAFTPSSSSAVQTEVQAILTESATDEFAWYEGEE